jgi:DNA-binding NtrC family response regulator
MPKKPKENSPPRSLFKSVTTPVPVPPGETLGDLVKHAESLSPRARVERYIAGMKADAVRAAADPRLADYAGELEWALKDLQAALARNDAYAASSATARAQKYFDMLIADKYFAAPVRAWESADEGHRRKRIRVTKAEAIAAVAECRGNKARAAEMLGISRGILYERLRSGERTD